MKKMLLLSGSSYKSTGYLEHCRAWIDEFLKECKVFDEEILFIPFAGVRRSNDEYEKKAIDCLKNPKIKSIHKFDDKKDAVKKAKCIAVGGGNTFMLLHYLYEFDLIKVIKEKVESGTPYFGWSAGANIAGKTIMTTNDMPIIMPKSFNSLNLFPHQINPHFISGKIPGHNGESREERLQEFLIANKEATVFALPEGSGLKIKGDEAEVIGHADILKMRYEKETQIIKIWDKFSI